jgi:hypothetical protein
VLDRDHRHPGTARRNRPPRRPAHLEPAHFANLLAAARATLAADHDGEDDPLSYLRDEVDQHQPIQRDAR